MTKNSFYNLLSFLGIVLALAITTIGYSAFNSNLTISGEARIKIDNNISVIDLNVTSTLNNAYEEYNSKYSNKTIDYHLVLPEEASTITYKINIQNKTNRDYGIASISGLSEELTYELVNYNLGDKICTNAICNDGQIDEIYLKIKYKPNYYNSLKTNFSGRINLEIAYFYNVIYKNIPNSMTLKQNILKGTDYNENISIPLNHKLVIRMNGVLLTTNNYSYDLETNLLVIPSVISNIVIALEEIGNEFDLSSTGSEKSFKFENTNYDINTKTFYLEADLSSVDLTDVFEDIISLGNDIDNWLVSKNKIKGANLHIYYPAVEQTKSIEIDITYVTEQSTQEKARLQKVLNLGKSNLLRIAFNSNGLYVNGEKIFDETGKGSNVDSQPNDLIAFLATYFDCFKTNDFSFDIGSTEGDNRSSAIYNEIKIYDNLLTKEELISKTKVEVEELPVEEEITYDFVSIVKINNGEATDINYPFTPNNNSFIFTEPKFIDLNSNSLYLEMDVSNLKENAITENLISVGNDFTGWIGNNVYDFHVFYPYTENSTSLAVALLHSRSYTGQFRADVTLIDNKFIKMMLCSRGLYINGEKWLDSTGFIKEGMTVWGNNTTPSLIVSKFFEKFTFPSDTSINFMYGSEQGDNRSSATYNDIRIYDGLLAENQIIELTS